jgi:hypothetical protein
MKTDYRKQLIEALDGLEGQEAAEFREFVSKQPLPCWGAIYKRFGEVFKGSEALASVFEHFCKTPGCDRFLLLLLHLHRDTPAVVEIFLERFDDLPALPQAYFICMPEGSEAVKSSGKKARPEVADLLDDPALRAREREVLLAKVQKLLSHEWAPCEEHNEGHDGRLPDKAEQRAVIPPQNNRR